MKYEVVNFFRIGKNSISYIDFFDKMTNRCNENPKDASAAVFWANENKISHRSDWCIPPLSVLLCMHHAGIGADRKKYVWSRNEFCGDYCWMIGMDNAFLEFSSVSSLGGVLLVSKGQIDDIFSEFLGTL